MPSAAPSAVKFTRAELAERARRYRAAFRRAVAPPPEEPLSRWAERVMVLPRAVSAADGPLSFARTPYCRGVLDAFGDPAVERITWVSSTQIGKTTVEIAMLGAAAAYDPGPALSVQPNDSFADSFALERVIPVFRASPELARLMPRSRGVNSSEILLDAGVLNFGSARSSASLASRAKRYLVLGETDEYPAASGKGGNPIAQAEERLRTYWNRKIYESSTPKHRLGYIWQSWLVSCQHYFYVPCPHCGTFQVLWFAGDAEKGVPGPAGRINWPRDEKGAALHHPDELEEKRLAWYECGSCGAVIEENQKEPMVARGEWRPVDPAAPRRHIGFHLWAAYSPWLTFSAIAAKYLRVKDYPELMVVFVNKWLGRPYEERGEKPKMENVLARRRESYLMGQVPEGVRFLTGSVDVHGAMQYWMVWGWGAGFTGWLIAAGREDTAVDPVAGWERVFAALTREYPAASAGATALRIGQPAGLALVDCGWDRPEDPEENVDEWRVLSLCDEWNFRVRGPLFQPSKGASSASMFPPLGFHRSVDRDRDGKPLKGRLQLHSFNPWFFKKSFYSRLGRADQVGGFWLPADLPRVLIEQMLGEEMLVHPDGREEWVKRGANHGLDCAVLCLAAAWKYRQYLESPPPAPAPRGPAPESPPNRPPAGTPLRLPEKRLTP